MLFCCLIRDTSALPTTFAQQPADLTYPNSQVDGSSIFQIPGQFLNSLLYLLFKFDPIAAFS